MGEGRDDNDDDNEEEEEEEESNFGCLQFEACRRLRGIFLPGQLGGGKFKNKMERIINSIK